MIHFSFVLSSISGVSLKCDNKVVTIHCIALTIFLNQPFGKKPPTNMMLYFAVENEIDQNGKIKIRSYQMAFIET